MIVKAIVDYLSESSSIDTVVPDGAVNQNVTESLDAYVLVRELSMYGSARERRASVTRIAVRACFPRNYQIDLDRYILFEVYQLLHNKILTVTNGSTVTHVKASVTTEISSILHDNEDKYIARERVIEIPSIWR